MEFIIGMIAGFVLAVVVGYALQRYEYARAEKFYEQIGLQLRNMAKELSEESTLVIEKHDDTYYAYRKHDMKFMCQFTNKDELVAKLKEINPYNEWLTDKDSLELLKGMK